MDIRTLPPADEVAVRVMDFMLEEIKVARNVSDFLVGGMILGKLRLERYVEPMLREVVLTLCTHVVTQQLESREHVVCHRVPASWVDHLRKRLGWNYHEKLLRTRVIFKVKARYPEANDVPADLGKPVKYSMLDTRHDEVPLPAAPRGA